MMGCSWYMYLLGIENAVLVPLRVFSIQRSTEGVFELPFKVVSRKEITGDNDCVVLGVKNFKPLPQNRILVSLKGSFQNLQ